MKAKARRGPVMVRDALSELGNLMKRLGHQVWLYAQQLPGHQRVRTGRGSMLPADDPKLRRRRKARRTRADSSV
jgi:hypothetical protein